MAKAEEKSKKKVTKKKDTKKKVPKENYLKRVTKELKLVKWPNASEVIKYTVSTIVFVAILCGVFMLLNLLLSVVKGWLV